jgi:hypothetical protein
MNYGKILDIGVERHTVESIISGELKQFSFFGTYPHINELREKEFFEFYSAPLNLSGMNLLNRILNLTH